MNGSTYQLRIGTTGWEEIPHFYPDDLPEEWGDDVHAKTMVNDPVYV